MNDLLTLFVIFFRVGALTFGGGYAMMPILQKEIVEKKGWATSEEVMDYYAISQCTPGIIAVNTSIFLGYKIKKTWGAIAAALGIVTPSMIIIVIIAMFIQNIMDIAIVQNAFNGIRVAVCALVVQAAITMLKKGVVDKMTGLIAVAVFATLLFTDISSIPVVLITGALGIAVRCRGGKKV